MPSRRDFLKGALAAGAALPWAACSGGSPQPAANSSPGGAPAALPPRSGGTLRVGLNSDLTTMDPHLSTAAVDRQVYQAIYDPLIRLQPDLSLAPGLAEKWEVSADGANYTFYLRQGISFHDGERFDANAVKYNFERMLSHPKSLRRGELAEVEAIEVVGDYSVRLRLKQPSSPLLAQLTDRAGMMISPRAAETEGEDFARRPVGTGPFRFIEWVKDDHLTVRKSPEYWDKADGSALPYLDEVTYRPVPDVNVQLTSLRTGALDLVDRIPPKDIAALKQGKDPLLSEVPALAFEYLDMNHARPPFDQLNNRLALLWAIAREPIIRAVFFGSGTPAHGPIPPLSWAYRKEFQPFTRDLARARQLAPNGFSFTAIVANTPVRKQ